MSRLTAEQQNALDNWAAGWLERMGAPTTFEAAVTEKLRSGLPYLQVVSDVAKERPDLYDKYRRSVQDEGRP